MENRRGKNKRNRKGEIKMSEAYFEKQYKSTTYTAYCSECKLEMTSLPDTEGANKDFVDCILCGGKLENHQRVVDVWQDPKYTTASC